MNNRNKKRKRLNKAVRAGDYEAYIWALVENVCDSNEILFPFDSKNRIKNDLIELSKIRHSIQFDKRIKELVNE